MKFLKILWAFVLGLPLVSAYTTFSYYLRTPGDLLNNEWFLFILIFAIFFAVIYYSVSKTFTGNKGVAVVLSGAIAILIAGAVSRRAWYYGYLGETIGSWMFILAAVIGIFFLMRFASRMFGGIGILAILVFGWYIVGWLDYYGWIPYDFSGFDLYFYIKATISVEALYTLLGAIAVIFLIAYAGKGETAGKVKNWLWGKKEEKEHSWKLVKG